MQDQPGCDDVRKFLAPAVFTNGTPRLGVAVNDSTVEFRDVRWA